MVVLGVVFGGVVSFSLVDASGVDSSGFLVGLGLLVGALVGGLVGGWVLVVEASVGDTVVVAEEGGGVVFTTVAVVGVCVVCGAPTPMN